MVKRLLDIFSLRMRRNSCSGPSSKKKIWRRHSLRRPRFLIRRVYFHYPMTLMAYIRCFVHNFVWPCDLDLLTLAVSDELRAWHIKHTYKFLAPYGSPFLSYVWLNLITLASPGTVSAHAPCHVTYHREQKWSTFLKSLTLIYPFTLSFSRSYEED